jgi:hypothetical protein
VNWSNPSQGQTNTAAQIQSQYKPETVSIAPIVAALLQKQYHDQEIQQQQYQDMIKGIGSAASAYGQQQNASSANDAANAAIYGQQYPNDPYGGYQDPDKVPDYGGTDALKAEKLAGDPYKAQLEQAKINSTNALANSRWSGGGTGDTSGYNPASPETVTDEQGREWRRGSGGQWFPMFTAASQYRNGTGKNAPSLDPQTVYPDDESAPPPDAPLPPDTRVPAGGKGAGTVSSNDVNQASQAPGMPPKNAAGQYPVGTKVNQGGVVYEKQADGSWQPVQ